MTFRRVDTTGADARVMMRERLIIACNSAAALLLPANLLAWGDAGHRMIGLGAAERLPADMPAFFRAAGQQLGYLNPEPDRQKDRAEATLDRRLAEARHRSTTST